MSKDTTENAPPSLFISYSHQDRETVLPLASHLGRMGFQVWMDSKDLRVGASIIESVSKAIETSDLYLVALSAPAISSKWVSHELNTALSLEIMQGRPLVVPLMLSKVDVPVALRSRLFIDLSGLDLEEARRRMDAALKEHLPASDLSRCDTPAAHERTELAVVELELRARTTKYYGGPVGADHTREEVTEEASDIVKRLSRRAHGVLLNFVAASDMDFSSPHPRFPNGEVTPSLRDVPAELSGTIATEAVVRVQVLNPDEARLNQLVSSKLSSLGVARATYTFLISPPIGNFAQLALAKLQTHYVILGWDRQQGADVELPDDLRLCVYCSDDRIRIGIETQYPFQFEKRAKQFSVREFVAWLMKAGR